jgi:hypothetical protein
MKQQPYQSQLDFLRIFLFPHFPLEQTTINIKIRLWVNNENL